MAEVITLPPGVALSVLAFLLSLVPAGLFLWLWYLRRQDRTVPAGPVAIGLVSGMILVAPAFYLETWVAQLWETYFPATVHYFQGTFLPVQSWSDILLPAAGTFLVVAMIEEGLRYILLLGWFKVSHQMDQVFDGLVIGTVLELVLAG
jgi:RsiW-degrading membrane proteinase PrsW (M82 family)